VGGTVGAGVTNGRLVAGDIEDPGVSHPEPDITAVPVAGVGQVDEHVGLRVEPR